jgi:hypothetical protein
LGIQEKAPLPGTRSILAAVAVVGEVVVPEREQELAAVVLPEREQELAAVVLLELVPVREQWALSLCRCIRLVLPEPARHEKRIRFKGAIGLGLPAAGLLTALLIRSTNARTTLGWIGGGTRRTCAFSTAFMKLSGQTTRSSRTK